MRPDNPLVRAAPPGRGPGWRAGPLLVVVAASAGTVLLSELVRRLLTVPNPLPLTLIAVVFCAARFGTRLGLASAAMISGYGLALFEAGWLDAVPPTSASRALAVWILAPVMALIVGALRERQARDTRVLLHQEGAYRQLVERAPDAIVVHADGHVLFANDAALALLGAADRALVIGRLVTDILQAEGMRALPASDDEGRPAMVRLQRLDGSALDVEALSRPIHFENRDATQVVLRDVARRFAQERERAARKLLDAEDAAHSAQARFRAVQDASPDPFALYRPLRDGDGRVVDFEFLYCNPAGSRAMGQEASPLEGKTLLGLFPHRRDDPLFAVYVSVVDAGAPYRGEHRIGVPEVPQWTELTAIRIDRDLAVMSRDTTIRHVAAEYLGHSNLVLERRVDERTAALRESEARYRSLLAATPAGIAQHNADLSIGAWNAAAERLSGLTAEQLAGHAPRPAGWEAVTEDGSRFDLNEHPSLVALRTGQAQADRVMGIRHPDGRLVWISMNTTPLVRDGETVPYAAITSFADITARRQTDALLRESEQRYALLAMQAPVGIFHTDAVGACTFVNERYCELGGIAAADALGDGWREIIHPEDRYRVSVEWMDAALQGRSFRLEYRLLTPRGDTRWVEGSAEAIVGAGGTITGYVGSIHDVSERKRTEDTLRAASLRDDLTGLYNRRGFFAFAERECKRARRQHGTVLILYADVDAFKSINDTHGHRVGDDALGQVAAALEATCRDTDVIARLGGDEFVALSVHESPAVAAIAEEAMRNRLAMHLRTGRAGRAYDLVLSAGAASSDDPSVTLETLLARADDALYDCKRKARDQAAGGVETQRPA